jgi:hypothetical protein|nr:hypothetical protein [Neorhizobium tomejilense]
MIECRDFPYSVVNGDLYHVDSSGHKQRVCHSGSAIAVAYDIEDGVLHRHGEYNAVLAWYDATRAVLMKQEATAGLAKALCLVSMPLDERWVSEINRCIATTGAVLGIEQRIRDQYLEEMPVRGVGAFASAPLPTM